MTAATLWLTQWIGVPQGYCLSPTNFLFDTSELSSTLRNVEIILLMLMTWFSTPYILMPFNKLFNVLIS